MSEEIIKVDGLQSAEQVFDTMRKFGNQVDFATSVAINRTAIAVQDFTVKKLLPKKFTLRKPWFKPRTRFGFNIKFSNKKNLEASVGSQAPWLEDHEEGGTRKREKKTPNIDKRLLTMPVKEIRQDSKRLTPAKYSPSKIFSKKSAKAFWLTTAEGDILLMQRVSKGKNKGLKVLFSTAPQAKINKTLEFFETGKRIVAKRYQFEMARALKEAMKTANGTIK